MFIPESRVVCICDQKCYHVSVTLNFEVGHKRCRARGRSENPEGWGLYLQRPCLEYSLYILSKYRGVAHLPNPVPTALKLGTSGARAKRMSAFERDA